MKRLIAAGALLFGAGFLCGSRTAGKAWERHIRRLEAMRIWEQG